ncbi:hypothetical protein MAR_028323 [Mya arenaria]|uniref:Protein quiver n=1 Tax=Mya arenaria TaxID=6604 RepID=A0ABY7DFF8_MYAAR|nr:hypothetical protein MAR_028323 [Mya arenaria]
MESDSAIGLVKKDRAIGLVKKVITIDCCHCASLAGDHKESEDVFARDITTEQLISRECTTGYWKAKFCIKLKGQGDIDGCVETCDFDGCNLATTTHCNIPMICLTVISCLLLWTRWRFL